MNLFWRFFKIGMSPFEAFFGRKSNRVSKLSCADGSQLDMEVQEGDVCVIFDTSHQSLTISQYIICLSFSLTNNKIYKYCKRFYEIVFLLPNVSFKIQICI